MFSETKQQEITAILASILNKTTEKFNKKNRFINLETIIIKAAAIKNHLCNKREK